MKLLAGDLLETIITKYGKEEQLLQTMGECGELVAVIQNYLRAKKFGHRTETFDDVAEEAVDVYNMIQQIRHMNPEKFDEIFERKKKKILKKLDYENENKRFAGVGIVVS